CVSEPARVAGPVLRADDPLLDDAACRPAVRPAGLGLRRVPRRACLHPRDQQRYPPPRPGVRRGRACADDHVGDLHDPHPARHLMTPGARLSAAIEVIADIETRRRPAADALKDWGLAHRFAGSGAGGASAGLGCAAWGRRASGAHVMGAGAPRALLLGMLRLERKLNPEAVAALADGARFAPAPLTAEERARLESADLDGAPPWVAGDYPEWLDPYLARGLGEEPAPEVAAVAGPRPPRLPAHPAKGAPAGGAP